MLFGGGQANGPAAQQAPDFGAIWGSITGMMAPPMDAAGIKDWVTMQWMNFGGMMGSPSLPMFPDNPFSGNPGNPLPNLPGLPVDPGNPLPGLPVDPGNPLPGLPADPGNPLPGLPADPGNPLPGLPVGPGNPLPMVPMQQPDPVNPERAMPVSSKNGVGQQCSGVAGICQDIELESCPQTRLRGKCPGPNSVMCCPGASNGGAAQQPQQPVQGEADPNVPLSSGSGSCGSYAGLAFPLAPGSLLHISVNWGGSRSSGQRCHAALDIYTSGAKSVQAMSDGVVTAIRTGWYTCSGGSIDAIFVYHTTGALAGKTLNYGEMDPGTYSVSVGSSVRRGQRLGTASRCGMLHLELYSGRKTANERWYPRGAIGAGCQVTSMSTKPASLLDPRPLVRCTMPAGAQFRHGVGFLNQELDAKLFADDLMEIQDDTGESFWSVGSLIGIVLGVIVLVVLIIAGVVYVMMKKNEAKIAANDMEMATSHMATSPSYAPSYAQPATMGAAATFACHECGKSYHYADDLSAHMTARH